MYSKLVALQQHSSIVTSQLTVCKIRLITHSSSVTLIFFDALINMSVKLNAFASDFVAGQMVTAGNGISEIKVWLVAKVTITGEYIQCRQALVINAQQRSNETTIITDHHTLKIIICIQLKRSLLTFQRNFSWVAQNIACHEYSCFRKTCVSTSYFSLNNRFLLHHHRFDAIEDAS